MIKLAKFEQETIINFNQEEFIAYIYTCSKAWIRHFEKVLGLKPTKTYSYAREYECPKTWIKLPRKPRKLSGAKKQEFLRRIRQTSNLSEKTPYTVGKSGGEK